MGKMKSCGQPLDLEGIKFKMGNQGPEGLTLAIRKQSVQHSSQSSSDDSSSQGQDSEGRSDGSEGENGEYAQPNPVLYTSGLESDEFFLILSGNVQIESGDEKFLVNYTKFNYMGERALQGGKYIPDFDANVKGHAKLLMIKRKAY